MSIEIKQLHPLFAAELTGVDVCAGVDASTQLAVQAAMDEHAVLVLPEQRLDDEKQMAFAERYGPLEVAPPVQYQPGSFVQDRRIKHRQIFDVSNLDEYGRILGIDDQRRAYSQGNQLWHTDSSFRQKSATWSLLHARVIPPTGADTEFADTRAAYDALPQAMKDRLEGLIAEHSIWHSRAQTGYRPTEEERKARPPAQHPVVRRHPGSGRKALYIASHASHIVGWPVEEGRALLRELLAFATEARFVYAHKWRSGDLVIWDNRCTLHRATPFESTQHIRDMRRTTVIDTRAEAMAS
jgi:alpha-ketoglutarate-dependent 2,4-dichlorophenoxyacetate dioxygenase